MSPHYAEKIAPVLAKALKEPVKPIDLLPPGTDAESPVDPLHLLHTLGKTVDLLEQRVAHLERRRGSGGAPLADTEP